MELSYSRVTAWGRFTRLIFEHVWVMAVRGSLLSFRMSSHEGKLQLFFGSLSMRLFGPGWSFYVILEVTFVRDLSINVHACARFTFTSVQVDLVTITV